MNIIDIRNIIKEEIYLLKEGNYDKLVGELTKQILNIIKDSYSEYLEEFNGEEQKEFYQYDIDEIPDNKKNLDFTIEFYIRRGKVDNFEGIAFDGGAYDEEDVIEIILTLDPSKEPKNYRSLVGILKDVLRHEITHLTNKPASEKEKLINFGKRFKTSLPGQSWTYFILPEEIPAMVNGLVTKAKNNKTSFEYEAKKYLSTQRAYGEIETNEQYLKIFNIWNNFYKKHYNLKEDKISGGLADNKSIEDIVKKHKTTLNKIKKQILMGIKIEMEHTNNKDLALEITKDHLIEDPEYYTKLKNANL